MSDDSDWESDHEEEEQQTQGAAASQTDVAPSEAASAAAASSAAAAPPAMLLALPITLSLPSHPALAGGIPAGVTLLHDAGKGGLLSLLVYDAARRPLLLEVLDGAKMPRGAKLPFAFTPEEASSSSSAAGGAAAGAASAAFPSSATLVDSQARKWTLSFASAHDLAHFAALLALASLVARAGTAGGGAAATAPLCVKHDLARGGGKSVKAKQFVSLRVRAWVTLLSADSSQRGVAALARLTATTNLHCFNPPLAGDAAPAAPGAPATPLSPPLFDTVLPDVEVAEEEGALVPTSLGEALAGGGKLKSEGGSRLLVLPAASPLARQILAAHGPPTFAPEASFVTLQLTPLAVSKKREKKSKKGKDAATADAAPDAQDEKEFSAQADAPAEEAAATAVPPAALDFAAAASVATPSSSQPSLFPAWSRDVTAASSAALAALQSAQEQVGALPGVQQKLVKSVMAELYEGLLDDLGLRAVVEAQASEDEAVRAGVDAAQVAQVVALQGRVRGLVASFVQLNSDPERKGTLAALVESFKGTLLPAIQPLVSAEPEGLLSSARLDVLVIESSRAAAAAAASSSSSAELASLRTALAKAQASASSLSSSSAAVKKLESELKSARAEADKSRRTYEELQSKHTSLVMAHVDLEEKLSPLQRERDALKKDAQMAAVFQQGLADMRGMLEKEIEEKNRMQEAWQDLQHANKSLKVTWFPEKATDRCMRCENKFGMFGSSARGHCRYCGRLFCGKCCGECALPELGFPKPVKVCRPCLAFRGKVMGDANAAQAAAQADEAEAASGGAAGASGARNNGKETVLSYPSDIDED